MLENVPQLIEKYKTDFGSTAGTGVPIERATLSVSGGIDRGKTKKSSLLCCPATKAMPFTPIKRMFMSL